MTPDKNKKHELIIVQGTVTPTKSQGGQSNGY